MRVLIINSVCGTGSTGRICSSLAEKYLSEGHEVKAAYGRFFDIPNNCKKYAVQIGDFMSVRMHAMYTRLTDRHGFASKRATQSFLKWADEYDPDLVWIHNIHGYYINIEFLFEWLKQRNQIKPQMEIRWTLHDCWAFTGHCAYFTACGCDKWKHACNNCPQIRNYPEAWIDGCSWNYERKKTLFTGVKNLTLITPSKWLADLLKESFLAEYPVEVINNRIDETVFRDDVQIEQKATELRKKYNLTDKKTILAAANIWDERKGLADLKKLLHMMDCSYSLVIVGATDKQIEDLKQDDGHIIEAGTTYSGKMSRYSGGIAVDTSPAGLWNGIKIILGEKQDVLLGEPDIISIPHVNSAEEMAVLYKMADVFVNPTHEDNYPTVNLEAIACGTPVVTYDVGGVAETMGELIKSYVF